MSPSKWDFAVEKLASQIERDTGVAVNREKLADVLTKTGMAYDGARFWNDDSKRRPLPMEAIEPAINHIISLLSYEPNKRLLSEDPNEREWLPELMRDLKILRTKALALSAPAKPRHRRDHDLYDAVGSLKDYWTKELGLKFTNEWNTESDGRLKNRRLPISNAARFVYSAMTLIDRPRIRELEKVMANIIGNR